MAKIHVLEQNGINTYHVVVHAPTPAGSNNAGVLWSAALVGSGKAVTQLPVGNGAGQITNAEANQITAGTLFEASGTWGDDPNWTNAERIADLDLRASQIVAEKQAEYATLLRNFGFTRN